jgi:ribonuclease T2
MKRLLAVTLILCIAITIAAARSRHRNQTANTPGVFDYYLLTLSWAPDYCAMPNAKQNSRECANGNHVGFVVHGLWPQFNNGGYPKECAPARPVASDIVTRMLTYIPDAGLVQHEWKEHGTCSGQDAATYFGQIRQVFDSVKIPDQYKTLDHSIDVSPNDVEVNFASANASFPMGAVHVGCGGGKQLSDVRICFTKDLQAQACPATEKDCTASTLTMLGER